MNNKFNFLSLKFKEILKQKHNIDMTRGKPCKEQLSLSNDLINNIKISDVIDDKFDYRNYTNLQDFTGLNSLKTIFAELFNVEEKNIIIGGNSSINLIFDIIAYLKLKLINKNNEKFKFICPTPGYDRHFKILEELDIDMISVPLTGEGPDMDIIENLVSTDNSIKGMICVPKYSNPTGETYSYNTLIRLAKMKTLSKQFKIIFDNAYAIHDLYDYKKINSTKNSEKSLLEIFYESDRMLMFSSTSKITYPGGGISLIIANDKNIKLIAEHLIVKTIGFDKINQIRHAKLLKNKKNILEHMKCHAQILVPKFEQVYRILEKELGTNQKFATWTKPQGGYFISFYTKNNLAKKIVKMCLLLGIKFTKAGTTYPYNNNPQDNNIRIAPTFLSIEEIKISIEALSIVTKIATIDKYYY